nr:hypothetical protein CFP56_58770 [Quercus suber]
MSQTFLLTNVEGSDVGDMDVAAVLRHFQAYVQTLRTQTVTVTCSSLVQDMLQAYDDFTRMTGTRFRGHDEIDRAAREFLFTRECFFFVENRLPVVRATFFTTAADLRGDELRLQIQFAGNPPVLDFEHLCNVAHEGDTFKLLPLTVSSPPLSWLQPHTTEYFVGSAEDWLRWDPVDEAFTGTVPPHLASRAGAERLDQFTTMIELTAIMTKTFASGMRFERIFRVAIPLTVQRHPDVCATLRRTPATPRPHATNVPLSSTATLRKRSSRRTSPSLQSSPTFSSRSSPPRSAFPRVLRRVRPAREARAAASVAGKENEDISLKDLSRLLKRKAQHGRSLSTSPPPTLVRFHDMRGESHSLPRSAVPLGLELFPRSTEPWSLKTEGSLDSVTAVRSLYEFPRSRAMRLECSSCWDSRTPASERRGRAPGNAVDSAASVDVAQWQAGIREN